MQTSAEMAAALDAAAAAAKIARALYRRGPAVRIKPDGSPVSEADERCEAAIREILEARFPEHGFFGEETGASRLHSESVWLVDPIDGTKAYVRGYDMFSTQIALMRRGEVVLGVSSAPTYGELAHAERGRGAYLDGARLAVSRVDTLESAVLSSGNLTSLASGPQWTRYGALVARVYRSRGYGDFLQYHLLAAGMIDVVIETDINVLDIAACAALVEEAGGRFTDLAGSPVTLATRSVLATNGRLHEAVLTALS